MAGQGTGAKTGQGSGASNGTGSGSGRQRQRQRQRGQSQGSKANQSRDQRTPDSTSAGQPGNGTKAPTTRARGANNRSNRCLSKGGC